MHVLHFGIKRAFHAILKVNRPLLARSGVTPARFDLLFAIHSGDARTEMEQSSIRRTLGVTRPTVSRMVRSLEELGLVTRSVSYSDLRTRLVRLTKAGKKVLARVLRKLIRAGVVDRGVRRALYFPNAPPSARNMDLSLIGDLDATLMRIRRCFGDFASLDYPWYFDH